MSARRHYVQRWSFVQWFDTAAQAERVARMYERDGYETRIRIEKSPAWGQPRHGLSRSYHPAVRQTQ